MLRVSYSLLLGLVILAPASTAKADWHTFWNRVHLDWHRNNCWPEPFHTADRQSVCQAFSATVASGWRRQTTLGEVYFDTETQTINEAGRRKLWSILTTAPVQYRSIYVVRTMDGEVSERRLDSVQQAAAEMFVGEPLPEVIAVNIEPRSWPADYIDAIDRKRMATIGEPRLPEFVETTGN